MGLTGNRVGIMQPYLLPHISYFQLISTCDVFCLQDKVKYTKQSWINRNRLDSEVPQRYFTLPLQRSSDFDSIDQKLISHSYDSKKILQVLKNKYRQAPNFEDTFPILENVFNCETQNLFEFLKNSINTICRELHIETPLINRSDIEISSFSSAEEMVINICKALDAEIYLNSIGGTKLYTHSKFESEGIALQFLELSTFSYLNSRGMTDSGLSIVDALMWADRAALIEDIKMGAKFVKGRS